MKISLFIVVLLTQGLMCLGAEDDPFAEGSPDPPRPERKIASVPDSIAYKKLKADEHVYTISGIYSNERKGVINDEFESSCVVPNLVRCNMDFDKGICTLLTSRKLTMSELAYAVDDMASMAGEVPYWLELEARDIPKGALFGDIGFTVKPFKGEIPKGLGWFWLGEHSVFTIPFQVGFPAKLNAVPTTAHCMAHSRFAIRILDGKGELVWHNDSTAYAATRVAIVDLDEDGIHELLIDRDDHGKKARYIMQRK